MMKMDPPKTKKQLRRFIGMVNYYRDMWKHRSDVLSPLTAMTSKSIKWCWGESQQKAFDKMKQVLGREIMLTYPDFNKSFEIHTDASDTQLGAVISQENKPIVFYSRKLNSAQRNYTTTERELLSIVETLKEFRNILLGHQVTVYTDHKNLTYVNFKTARVMRWRLIIEEFNTTLKYIEGQKNVVADALSHLPCQENDETFEDMFAYDKDDFTEDDHPLSYSLIDEHQKKDMELLNKITNNKNFALKAFHGGGDVFSLICKHDKIVIPQSLQSRIARWYHIQLMHPGETRTEQSLRQHYD